MGTSVVLSWQCELTASQSDCKSIVVFLLNPLLDLHSRLFIGLLRRVCSYAVSSIIRLVSCLFFWDLSYGLVVSYSEVDIV